MCGDTCALACACMWRPGNNALNFLPWPLSALILKAVSHIGQKAPR